MGNILKLENLRKRYRDFTLNNISLEIPAGEIIGLIGENGAGKTTLISLLLGQIHRDAGKIQFFCTEEGLTERQIKMRIGYVLDECCYHKKLKPKHIASILKPIYQNWGDAEFARLLERFQIKHNQQIGELSKGMQIKLMLAVALSHHPRLLLLDECTSGLDPVMRDDVMEILKDFVKDPKNSVLFSTHITSDLEKAADKIAFLHQGRLIFYEAVQSLMGKYSIVTCMKGNEPKGLPGLRYRLAREDGTVSLLTDQTVRGLDNAIMQKNPSIDEIMAIMVKGVPL